MSEVKHYFWAQDGMSEVGRSLDTYVKSPVFDRVTAELVSANSDKEAYAQNAIDLRKRVDALQALLTAADERADVLEAENRRLRDDDLFYDAACEAMEGHQKERAKLGKEIGCQGSLIDGIAWIYQRLAELEKSPSGYTKQHHPVEFGPSDSRRIGCSCGHPDPNHETPTPRLLLVPAGTGTTDLMR